MQGKDAPAHPAGKLSQRLDALPFPSGIRRAMDMGGFPLEKGERMFRALTQALGRVLNSLGAPGFIRPHECHAGLGVPVEIRVDDRFTVVSVNNLRLMFHRLTGRFDGVVMDGDDCQRSATRRSAPSHSAPTPK